MCIRDRQQVVHDPLLTCDPVVLDLDEPIVLPENVLIHRSGLERGVVVPDLPEVPLFGRTVRGEKLRYMSPEASRSGDDPLAVFGEQLTVHPRLVVDCLLYTSPSPR